MKVANTSRWHALQDSACDVCGVVVGRGGVPSPATVDTTKPRRKRGAVMVPPKTRSAPNVQACAGRRNGTSPPPPGSGFHYFWRHDPTRYRGRCAIRAMQRRRAIRPPRPPHQGASRRPRDGLRDVRLPVSLLPRLRPHHHAALGARIRADGEGPTRLHQPAAHHAPRQRRPSRGAGRVRRPPGQVLADARPAVPAPGWLGAAQGRRPVFARARRHGRPDPRGRGAVPQLEERAGGGADGFDARGASGRPQHAHLLHRGRVARGRGPGRGVPGRAGLGLSQQDGRPDAVMRNRPSFVYRLSMRLAQRALPLAARFDKKVARGVDARRGVLERLAAWARAHRDPKRPLVWVHAPSVGEGLQAKPVLETLRAERPQWQLVYTFFSPSAERLARTLPVDLTDYLPFDRAVDVAAALDALQPAALVFSKLDVWPELTLAARRRGTKLGLISATVALDSSRLRWPARRWAEPAYRALDRVGTISEDDGGRLQQLGARREAIA